MKENILKGSHKLTSFTIFRGISKRKFRILFDNQGIYMKTSEKGIMNSSEVYFVTPSNVAKKIFLYITCTGHFYYEDSYHLERNNYNSFLIMYILSGSAKIFYRNTTYIAKKDDIVLLNCYEPHGYASIKDLETIWFHFDGCNAKGYFNELYESNECIFSLKDTYTVLKKMKNIFHELSMGINYNEAVQSADISRILAEFFAYPGQKETTKASLIEETIEYINNNITKELSNKELADKVSLSEFYFTRVFKRETGFTPHEYVVKTRINQAKILLKSTDLSGKEIAYLCGFANESSFSNTFKKNTNMTPIAFRKMEL